MCVDVCVCVCSFELLSVPIVSGLLLTFSISNSVKQSVRNGKQSAGRDESVSGIPMGPVGPVGISWEWEVLLYFRGNGKEHGNGLMGIGGNGNATFPHFPLRAGY